MVFEHVRLHANERLLAETAAFYEERLELPGLVVGETRLELAPTDADAFYHFALLVPGDRFDAALAWARERVELLPERETGEVVFSFSNWDALACYFHDPAGSIVELIAHRGLGARGTTGPFRGSELLGFSELGVVGDPRELARALRGLDLEVWDGTVDEPGRLAFVGEKGRTLILAPPGRGWLPTGRPAEPHPVEAVVAAPRAGEVLLPGRGRTRSTIRTSPSTR